MSTTIEETFNPAALANNLSSQSSAKATTNGASKSVKQAPTFPRLDFEPLYADLKACIGHNWSTYHDALSRFIRAEINNHEFGYITDEFIYASSASEHAHNALICAIAFNVGRDHPEPGPAAWVSAASEKPTASSASKPAITSDVAEQRLKVEVKHLPPRDRRRLKGLVAELKDEEISSTSRNQYQQSYDASRIRPPESMPTSGTGASALTKTNWVPEIQKRYNQPLFSETLEFPDSNAIQLRMNPICYENGIPNGGTAQAAELISIAAEVYIKDFLGEMFNRIRSNGPRYENGAGSGIFTAAYNKQYARQQEEVQAGKLPKTRDDDQLPVESIQAKARQPLGIGDIKTAQKMGFSMFNGMPLLSMTVNETPAEADYDEWRDEKESSAPTTTTTIPLAAATATHPGSRSTGMRMTNGVIKHDIDGTELDEDGEDDDDDIGWEGAGWQDRDALNGILSDCLAAR